MLWSSKKVIIILLATYTATAVSATGRQVQSKPNILFILADDLGYNGLYCYGNRWLETPNINRLYSEGMHFTNGLATHPVKQGFDVAVSGVGHYVLQHPVSPVELPEGVCAEEYFTDLAAGFMTSAVQKGDV